MCIRNILVLSSCTVTHFTHTHWHVCTHYRFVSKMFTPPLFILFSFLLKIVEGIGLAMFSTASMTLLTQLYLQRKGTLAVRVVVSALLLLKHHLETYFETNSLCSGVGLLHK